MSDKLGSDFVHYTADGLFFYESSSVVTPSTSQSAQSQITQITCSADFENNIASIGSLSGYFVVPLIGGFPKGIGEMSVGEDFAVASIQTSLIPSQLNVVYNTGSFFAVSSSNTNFYHQPTSSEDIINYILNVSIEKNDSPNLVALKTYNAITGSIIYRGATDSEGDSIGFNYISASLTGSAITIFNTFSQSIDSVFISGGANLGGIGDFTVGENFTVGYSPFASNIIQSGSYGSGSFTNFEAPRGTLDVQSSSLVIGRDVEDTTQSSFIFRVQSSSFGGTEHRDVLYISASEGKIGLGTTDPLTEFDIRADEFQIQRKTERKGLKINNEGNIESFSSDLASATTGSEFLLRYSRGIDITPNFMTTFLGLTGDAAGSSSAHAVTLFSQLKPDVQARALTAAETGGKIRPPATGDTLGQIRWVTDSGSLTGLNPRVTGETAVIKAVVSDVDTSGVRADLIFSVASKTAGAVQKFLIDANNKHQITGSLEISNDLVTKGTFTAGNNIIDTSTFAGNITASGNISASGTIITEDLQVDTITNHTAGGGIILDADGFIGIDSATGDIRFRHAGVNQLHFDMDGTDGAQVISPSVAGDDIIFKNQGGDSVLTLKSEGQTEIHGNITASGNISSSGTITAEHIVSSDDIVASGELFTNGTGLNKIAGILTLGSSTIPTGGNNLKVTGTSTFTSHITSSGNISSSGIVTGQRLHQGNTLINNIFAPIAGGTGIETVGALNAGSITSGFTSIDVGSGAITTTGTATLGIITATGNVSSSLTSTGSFGRVDSNGSVLRPSPNVYGSVIKLIPSDFGVNDDGGNTKFGVGYIEVAGTGYGMRSPNSNAELFAFVSIPEGMKATHVNIHAKSTYATEVFEVQIDATTVSSKGTGNCNTNLDITDVNATATNFLAIMVSITATTDKVYGGTVTIAAI